MAKAMRATTTTLSRENAGAIGACCGALALNPTRKAATKFLAPGHVVTVTRVGKRKTHGRSPSVSVVVTMGRPNYRQRDFVKACLKAGEPFPVKKIQLRGTW